MKDLILNRCTWLKMPTNAEISLNSAVNVRIFCLVETLDLSPNTATANATWLDLA